MKRELATRASKPCKRCGSTDIAWHQSERGKWYLIEVFEDGNGYPIASYRDFHSTYCGKPHEHENVQRVLTAEYDEEKAEQLRKREQQEEQRIADEAEKLNVFAAFSQADQEKWLDDLRKAFAKHKENYVSMDYFVEHCKWAATAAAMQAEIDMYEDFMEEN
jgi:hypothetical protein